MERKKLNLEGKTKHFETNEETYDRMIMRFLYPQKIIDYNPSFYQRAKLVISSWYYNWRKK